LRKYGFAIELNEETFGFAEAIAPRDDADVAIESALGADVELTSE